MGRRHRRSRRFIVAQNKIFALIMCFGDLVPNQGVDRQVITKLDLKLGGDRNLLL